MELNSMSKLSTDVKIVNRLTKLFQPLNIKSNIKPNNIKSVEKSAFSKGQELMLDLGIIRQSSNGIYHLLPLGLRVLRKIENIVRGEMESIDAQEVKLSHITGSGLWKKSGRFESGFGFFNLKDRHDRNYLLSPTNEEVAAELFSHDYTFSYKKLPVKLFQISTKFRDEIKPRCGLLKSREFVMKDLYCFDKSEEDARISYDIVASAYENIFKKIGLPAVKVSANPGNMGGMLSHEFHILSDVGEDDIIMCQKCFSNFNSEFQSAGCGCEPPFLRKMKGIEVGHTFLLGTTYSEPLEANFMNKLRNPTPLVMGSFGLGLTRILAGSVEYFSLQDQIRWPLAISPYLSLIITPKYGSKEADIGEKLGTELYHELNKIPVMFGNVLLDDRGNFTIGRKLLQAKNLGYPLILVIGSKALSEPPVIEVHDIMKDQHFDLPVPETITYCAKVLS